MRRFFKITALFAALAALFVVTAAPGVRGGFGGGRGGFSSGRSGGGFGGNGSGMGRSSYGGGYGAGYAGGGYRPYSGYWGGPRFIFFGGGGFGLLFVLVIVGGIVLVAGASAISNWSASRYTLVNVAVNLRNGKRYTKRLDSLLVDSDFTEPAGRTRAMHRLAKMIDTDDVVDGFLITGSRLADREAIGEQAENLARSQMSYIGINADAVNVANTEGQSVLVESTRAGRGGVGDGPDMSDAALVVILATVRAGTAKQISAGGAKDALLGLHRLYELTGKDLDALYFYYAPTADEMLDSHHANRIFLDLRSSASSA